MKKLYLSTSDRKISGVCGGFGKYLGIDSMIVRIITVLLVIATGIFPIVIAYILAAWLLPEEPKHDVVSEQ